jgi:hypothetical protein
MTTYEPQLLVWVTEIGREMEEGKEGNFILNKSSLRCMWDGIAK